MQSGKLRHKINVEKQVPVKSGTGAQRTEWLLHSQPWASIETLKMYERDKVQASWPGADVKICFRFIVGIIPTMRITYKGKIYSILGVNNIDERNRELELICETGVKAQ